MASELEALKKRVAELEQKHAQPTAAKPAPHAHASSSITLSSSSSVSQPAKPRSAADIAAMLREKKLNNNTSSSADQDAVGASTTPSSSPAPSTLVPPSSSSSLSTTPGAEANSSAASSSSFTGKRPAPSSSSTPSSSTSTILCRSWPGCTFKGKCRYFHPALDIEPLRKYGAELMGTGTAAASSSTPNNSTDSASLTTTSALAPVAAYVLLLLLSHEGSMELGAVWKEVRSGLQARGPKTQDEMLNALSLPSSLQIMQRLQQGLPVVSTDSFRASHLSVFCIRKEGGSLLLCHVWDEGKREENRRRMEMMRMATKKGHVKALPSAPPPPARPKALQAQAEGEKGEEEREGEEDGLPATLSLGQPSNFVLGGIITDLSLQHEGDDDDGGGEEEEEEEMDPFIRALKRSRRGNRNSLVTLSTDRIDPNNKGYAMLCRMNWKAGEGLGREKQGVTEPIAIRVKIDRKGL